jgi:hypothetical protein
MLLHLEGNIAPGIFISEHIHIDYGKENILMSVIFKVIAEGCLTYGNKNLLYIGGLTTVGSAYCGMIECRVIHVPCFVVSRYYKIDNVSGNALRKVASITDTSTFENVKKLLFKTFPSSLFLFS